MRCFDSEDCRLIKGGWREWWGFDIGCGQSKAINGVIGEGFEVECDLQLLAQFEGDRFCEIEDSLSAFPFGVSVDGPSGIGFAVKAVCNRIAFLFVTGAGLGNFERDVLLAILDDVSVYSGEDEIAIVPTRVALVRE